MLNIYLNVKRERNKLCFNSIIGSNYTTFESHIGI